MRCITTQLPTVIGTVTLEAPLAYKPTVISFSGSAWDSFVKNGAHIPEDRILRKFNDVGWPSIHKNGGYFVNIPDDRILLHLDEQAAGFFATRNLEMRRPVAGLILENACHLTDATDAILVLQKKRPSLVKRCIEILEEHVS